MMPLAAFDSNDLIPIIAICFTFGVPIIAMLLHHQRKMAESFRGQALSANELHQLQDQIHQLAQLVHQNTIAIDDLKSRLPASISSPIAADMQNRLEG